jgi:hypothetical protein
LSQAHRICHLVTLLDTNHHSAVTLHYLAWPPLLHAVNMFFDRKGNNRSL